MDQQRRIDLVRIRLSQQIDLMPQFREQCVSRRRPTDCVTNLPLDVNAALANGHRLRPMTARSSQRRVDAMTVALDRRIVERCENTIHRRRGESGTPAVPRLYYGFRAHERRPRASGSSLA